MQVVIAGSSGFIGTALRGALAQRGDVVRRLVRRPPEGADEVSWDPSSGVLDPSALEGADAVVNLAGPGIGDARWTEARKRYLWDARVESTELIARTIAGLDDPPAVFVNASAIGIYGDRGDEILTESSTVGPASDFLAALTAAWEAATEPAHQATRVALIRTGLVLDANEQLMGRLLPFFKLGLGGRLGSGDQWWSWISIDDEIRAILHILESGVAGPVNLTAPTPVTNAEFTKTLGDVLGRPAVVPVPKFALKTYLGAERGESLAFTSARVIPEVLDRSGFEFRHDDLDAALRAILST